MSLFVNKTRRSADELLADLTCCRQFRHLTKGKRRKIVEDTYQLMAELWIGREAIKNPNPNSLCAKCGTPRSKFSGSHDGLCYRCYATNGINERDLWVEDVFEMAVETYGFSCDACDEISDRKSTRLNSSHIQKSRMPSSA